MSNKTVFIKLHPESMFFFGGEQGITADYFLKGSFIPQQTALLGLLRHQILLQNNLMKGNKIINDVVASEWIGDKSFDFSVLKQVFGKISGISQCFIVNSENKYLPYFHEYISDIKKAEENYYFPAHDPKKHYDSRWKSISGNQYLDESSCFTELERIGVDKDYSGKTQNKSFYKQVWMKMKTGLSFGFYATFSDEVVLKDADVTFGKESAPFKMEVVDQELQLFDDQQNSNGILLLSDAYSKLDLSELCDFSISSVVPFRNLKNVTSANHTFYSRHKSENRLQLYQRGSVFASSNNLDAIRTELEAYTNFQAIGYNRFCQIKLNY